MAGRDWRLKGFRHVQTCNECGRSIEPHVLCYSDLVSGHMVRHRYCHAVAEQRALKDELEALRSELAFERGWDLWRKAAYERFRVELLECWSNLPTGARESLNALDAAVKEDRSASQPSDPKPKSAAEQRERLGWEPLTDEQKAANLSHNLQTSPFPEVAQRSAKRAEFEALAARVRAPGVSVLATTSAATDDGPPICYCRKVPCVCDELTLGNAPSVLGREAKLVLVAGDIVRFKRHPNVREENWHKAVMLLSLEPCVVALDGKRSATDLDLLEPAPPVAAPGDRPVMLSCLQDVRQVGLMTAKLEADALALWAVRVLDAWAARIGKSCAPCPDGDGAWFIPTLGSCFTGPTPDAARLAAAEALCAELGDACPRRPV